MCSCNICLCVFLTPSLSDIVDIVSATPSQPPSEAAKDGLDSDPMGEISLWPRILFRDLQLTEYHSRFP